MIFPIIILIGSAFIIWVIKNDSDVKINELEKKKINKENELYEAIKNLNTQLQGRLNPDEETIYKLKETINHLISERKNMEQYVEAYKDTYLDIVDKKNILEKLEKQEQTQSKKIKKLKELFKSIQYSIENFHKNEYTVEEFEGDPISIIPNTELKLHYMDVKELNKLFKENQKDIQKVLDAYEKRYTTKANKNIYHLMVVALQAELQNVLYNLKFEKLENSIEDIKATTQKYLRLAEAGNQTIVKTLINFIGEIEYLFINAVKIEYNYYVKKEQARQEQLAIRQQMREEAEERI